LYASRWQRKVPVNQSRDTARYFMSQASAAALGTPPRARAKNDAAATEVFSFVNTLIVASRARENTGSRLHVAAIFRSASQARSLEIRKWKSGCRHVHAADRR
jgi:hypothetical protein